MQPTRPEWFLEWFSSPYWPILYKNRDRKEAQLFVDALISTLHFKPENRILDLACGRGRHAIYLNQQGFDVTGVDISPENIAYAEQFANERLRFLVHDMRKPFPVFAFDWVLNLFTSFGYFQTEAENFRAIRAAADALRTGGQLVIDFMNTDRVLRELKTHETKAIDGYEFRLHKRVRKGFILKDIDFEIDGRNHHFQERVKMLRQGDFERYFNAAGLRPVHLFGDYALRPFDATQSERLIFVVEKGNYEL